MLGFDYATSSLSVSYKTVRSLHVISAMSKGMI